MPDDGFSKGTGFLARVCSGCPARVAGGTFVQVRSHKSTAAIAVFSSEIRIANYENWKVNAAIKPIWDKNIFTWKISFIQS